MKNEMTDLDDPKDFVTIYSTLSVDQTYMYAVSADPSNDKAALEKMNVIDTFTIFGGANVADLHGGYKIITLKGVANKVPTDKYKNVLLNSTVFEQHVKNGYLLVDETNSIDVDKAVTEMSEKDNSAQATEEDIKNLEKNVTIKSK